MQLSESIAALLTLIGFIACAIWYYTVQEKERKYQEDKKLLNICNGFNRTGCQMRKYYVRKNIRYILAFQTRSWP